MQSCRPDFGEDLLHRLLAFGVDDARAADVVAPLRGIGDGVPHVSQTAAIDEVDDELEFVQHFEVGALGLVTGLGQGFVARLDECTDAATEYGLLAEEVCLCLFFERGLKHSGAGAANALEVAEAERVGIAGCVWWTAMSPGTPPPSVNTSRTRWPGALGAAMPTSMPAAGTMVLK